MALMPHPSVIAISRAGVMLEPTHEALHISDACRRSDVAAHGVVSRAAQRQCSTNVPSASDGRAAPHKPVEAACADVHTQRYQPYHVLDWPEVHCISGSSSVAGNSAAWADAGRVPDLNLSPPDETAHKMLTRQCMSLDAADGSDAPARTLLDSLAGAAVRLAAEQSGHIT